MSKTAAHNERKRSGLRRNYTRHGNVREEGKRHSTVTRNAVTRQRCCTLRYAAQIVENTSHYSPMPNRLFNGNMNISVDPQR